MTESRGGYLVGIFPRRYYQVENNPNADTNLIITALFLRYIPGPIVVAKPLFVGLFVGRL
jgi:hypothetical protein